MGRIWRVHHPHTVSGAGADVWIDSAEAHYVARVLRLREEEPLWLFDGRGREWIGRIVEVERERVRVEIEGERTDAVEARLQLTLFQGLCRPERMEWVIQKATEIGVSAVRLLASERAERVRVTPKRLERWRRVALEACRQCGRRVLPSVDPADELPEAAGIDGPALVLEPGFGVRPLGDHAPESPPSAIWLAVGPESGFSPDEIERFRGAGWRAAGLGPRILRTETAGLVAASILLHRLDALGR
jgi:16S rRNA (uracil1498-N3)-methyltransferase